MKLPAPFGLFTGMKVSDISGHLKEIAPFKFILENPPKPHPFFSTYVLRITPEVGLSWIKGIGQDIQTNGYGYELKSTFEKMESKLKNTYGKYVKDDILMPESIWDKPNEWMMSLLKKERILGCSWETENGSSMPESIKSIYLGVAVSDTETGYIILEYALNNYDAAEAEISASQDGVL